ncbi:MAG: HD domain-containing protein [candidate division Zixibacteria bacterium]|nr:HD domain-containing protein [candidate division Zixibacteria bacterium]MBU1469542.1 HD domain-containing protein [candidate division Zixibacteria bacterium]MBU2624556.1 HD domain-containing protein [candidate division Zixibacteria bacterium]
MKMQHGGYLTIYLESLRIDSVLDFDLYTLHDGTYVLYRSKRLPFTENVRKTLIENGVPRLYVPNSDRHVYQKYVESNLTTILSDASIEETTRAGIFYDSAKYLVEEVLNNPTRGENIKRSQAMVESTVSFVLSRRDAFRSLLKVMSTDYCTYTHCVNVCTYSIALAQAVGITSADELHQLGTGAMLHDIGKSRIPDSVLNKRGILTPLEMEMIRKHPQYGFDIIKKTDIISEESCAPIIQHHEREDGSGYPNSIGSSYIHRYSKIVSIADVFDAMTTQRVYRAAEETYPVLKWMFENKHVFDAHFLEQFAKELGPGVPEGS